MMRIRHPARSTSNVVVETGDYTQDLLVLRSQPFPNPSTSLV